MVCAGEKGAEARRCRKNGGEPTICDPVANEPRPPSPIACCPCPTGSVNGVQVSLRQGTKYVPSHCREGSLCGTCRPCWLGWADSTSTSSAARRSDSSPLLGTMTAAKQANNEGPRSQVSSRQTAGRTRQVDGTWPLLPFPA